MKPCVSDKGCILNKIKGRLVGLRSLCFLEIKTVPFASWHFSRSALETRESFYQKQNWVLSVQNIQRRRDSLCTMEVKILSIAETMGSVSELNALDTQDYTQTDSQAYKKLIAPMKNWGVGFTASIRPVHSHSVSLHRQIDWNKLNVSDWGDCQKQIILTSFKVETE